MTKDDRLRVEDGITSTNVYRKVESYEVDRGELTTAARKLIKDIANHENDPELVRELGKPITRGYAHVGKLQETIKTHKDPGKVTARALHAAANCCFEGLGRYVSFKIRAQLQEYAGCIMSDAPMVCARLRKLSVTATSRFLRIDVKDFFYSGTVEDVVRDFQGVFHRHQRSK